jgi:hypothetical protein
VKGEKGDGDFGKALGADELFLINIDVIMTSERTPDCKTGVTL